MTTPPRKKRRRWLLLILLLLGVLLGLLRCAGGPGLKRPESGDVASVPAATPPAAAAAGVPPEERLTSAEIEPPAEVAAGAAFLVAWIGPDNDGDYLTIVPRDAPAGHYGNYRETRAGSPLELTAPVEPGAYEVRYLTARSRTLLGRAPVEVVAAAATLAAPERVRAGAPLSVSWTGPNHEGDYVTVVPAGSKEGQYRNYAYTSKGSPAQLAALVEAGPAELRYVTGQGARVLARRPLLIEEAPVTLAAEAEVVAGAPLSIAWTGPANAGDYLTIVPAALPDGRYLNYTETRKGSPLTVQAPMEPGPAEIRYQTGQGAKVLARRPVEVRAAVITLVAPAEVRAGSELLVEWTGPDNTGDYLTIVPAGTPDGRYQHYAETRRGSPLRLRAGAEPGEAEVRYMSGQGAKVLARRPVRVVAP